MHDEDFNSLPAALAALEVAEVLRVDEDAAVARVFEAEDRLLEADDTGLAGRLLRAHISHRRLAVAAEDAYAEGHLQEIAAFLKAVGPFISGAGGVLIASMGLLYQQRAAIIDRQLADDGGEDGPGDNDSAAKVRALDGCLTFGWQLLAVAADPLGTRSAQ